MPLICQLTADIRHLSTKSHELQALSYKLLTYKINPTRTQDNYLQTVPIT
jgi:hypothetical protein